MTGKRLMAAALAVAFVAPALSACSKRAGSDIAVAGDTRVDLVTVAAPRLVAPAIDVAVGITKSRRSDVDTPTASQMSSQMRTAATAAAAAGMSRAPVPAGVLATVTVRPGDSVKKGQVLAVFDDTMLKLGVENAKAAERKAKTTPDILAGTASDLRDTRADARRTGRAQIASGQEQIDAGREQIAANIAKIQAGVKQLPGLLEGERNVKAGLKQLRSLRDGYAQQLADARRAAETSSPPPGIGQKIAGLEAAITALDQNISDAQGKLDQLSQAIAGIGAGQAALPQLYAAQQKLASAQAKLDAGKEKLSSGLAKMADAIDQLETGSDIAKIAADVPSAGVAKALSALAEATLYAPSDGVVVAAMHPGELAMVGAPVVTIRPTRETEVDAYLTVEQLQRVKVGTSADVSMDSVRGVLHGRVRWISGEQEFAPSNYPTQIVHLSRVVRVTVTVPEQLPAGIPADVVIHPAS